MFFSNVFPTLHKLLRQEFTDFIDVEVSFLLSMVEAFGVQHRITARLPTCIKLIRVCRCEFLKYKHDQEINMRLAAWGRLSSDYRQTDGQAERQTDRVTDRQTDWQTDWETEWLTDWQNDWLTDRQTDWLTAPIGLWALISVTRRSDLTHRTCNPNIW